MIKNDLEYKYQYFFGWVLTTKVETIDLNFKDLFWFV